MYFESDTELILIFNKKSNLLKIPIKFILKYFFF